MADDLKPCPFCNAEMQFEESGYEHPYSDTCPLDSLYIEDGHVAAWNRRALPVSEPEPLAVRVKPLVWEETHDDRGDGSSEHNGCYEASTALGVYEISMGFGSDAYYWSACDPNYNEIGSFEDPSYAKAAAQADHDARVLSQIDAVPAAQVRAEVLEEAAALPPYDGDGDPAGSFDHHVFVKRDAIRALIEKDPNE